jgi:leader peptidase (prepilin peptidase)/N-methyltransferase
MIPAEAGAVTLAGTALLGYVAFASGRKCGIENILRMPVALAICLASAVLAAVVARAVPFELAASLLISLAFVNGATDIQSGVCFDTVQLLAAPALAVSRYSSLSDAASGLLVGIMLLGIPYILTKKRGIGLGDVKFAAAIGLGLGVSGEIQAVYIAFVAGGTAAACILLSGRAHRKAAIAFAPFLSFGTVCALVATRSL